MSGRVLCVGDAVVELVSARFGETIAFVPRLGGAVAVAGVAAASQGARVALAGGAGADEWGHWVRDRLEASGVDISGFALVPGAATPVGFVWGAQRWVVGGPLPPPRVELTEAPDALVLSSDGLVEPDRRSATMAARQVALDAGIPVVFAVALRLDEWRSAADAAASVNGLVAGALLVHLSAADAAVMTGEDDPEWAALALVKAGARMVVLDLGADGAILRGELRAEVEVPVPGLLGTLLARLALSDFYPPVVAAALRG